MPTMQDTLQISSRLNRYFGPAGPRFFLLFLFLLGDLILYPFDQGTGGAGYYLFRTFGYAAVLLSVYAVSFRRGFLLFALVLAIPSAIHHFLTSEGDASAFSVVTTVLNFLFEAFVIVVIFRKVFLRGKVTTETIYGALCIYLLIGFTFASLYGMLADIHPNAFYLDPKSNIHAVPNRFDLVYYSFGTLTSLGAAGITPVAAQARSISVMEAILGVLYLAVLISRLMGSYRESSGTD
jgi:Ion channel